MNQIKLATAIYEDGVLKLQHPSPGFADGDRVELAVVRVVPIDPNSPEEIASRERATQRANEIIAAAAAEPDDGYDILESLNANRLREGARPLIPSSGDR